MQAVLYTLAETIRHVAIMVQPFMPGAASAILDQLSVAADQRVLANIGSKELAPGTPLPKPEPVFMHCDTMSR